MSQEIVKQIRTVGLAGKPILDLNAFLKDWKEKKPADVNDASDLVTQDEIYKDENIEIIPVKLAP